MHPTIDAERRLAQFQSDHHNISKNMLKDILHEYAQSLHEGGISTLLAQACGVSGWSPSSYLRFRPQQGPRTRTVVRIVRVYACDGKLKRNERP